MRLKPNPSITSVKNKLIKLIWLKKNQPWEKKSAVISSPVVMKRSIFTSTMIRNSSKLSAELSKLREMIFKTNKNQIDCRSILILPTIVWFKL
jgi:hypothetical protein